MFKKDRKIANQKVMIEHRDELIETLSKKNEQLLEENIAVYEENKDLRFENDELSNTIKNLKKLIFNYEIDKTNIYTLIRDIKNELSDDCESDR